MRSKSSAFLSRVQAGLTTFLYIKKSNFHGFRVHIVLRSLCVFPMYNYSYKWNLSKPLLYKVSKFSIPDV